MIGQEALARRIFEAIREVSKDGEGVSRESYGSGEEQAMQIIEKYASELGISAKRDRFQNLWLRLAKDTRIEPPILIGSHLDSVPQGGNYDGLAGIVAGILILVRLRDDPLMAPPIRVLALRGEESAWYGKAYIGSQALLGKLLANALAFRHRDSHCTLGESMANMGIDVDAIARGEALVSPGDIAAWLELHIEQGPVMVARDLPSTVVTGIRGNIRYLSASCRGETGHSGAVPRWLRHDVVLAASELFSRMDEHWRVLLQMGMDLVMTVGIMATPPQSHAVSVIPGEVTFTFEIRSQDVETLERFNTLLLEESRSIEQERGVRFDFSESLYTAPATLDPQWIQLIEQSAVARGIELEHMASGAGHDAAVFANAGFPSAMVFIRNEHGSHNVHEAMEYDDFLDGVDLLFGSLLAKQQQAIADAEALSRKAG